MSATQTWQQSPFFPQYEAGAALFGDRSRIPLNECGEELVELPESLFRRVVPHPYVAAGAPYGNASPFFLRAGVVERLREAQEILRSLRPELRLLIWDGYRPLAVQEYMVEYSIAEFARAEGLSPDALSPENRERLQSKVLLIWARPSRDPQAPPPHSTGSAVDLTIVDESGREIDMGSPIDAYPPLCLPRAFAGRGDAEGRAIDANRLLLREVMCRAGFRQLPNEWWHFSYGDQIWAVLMRLETNDDSVAARYGAYARAES